MTTFKIVFTFDVFFSAETTMHCKVTCILYKKQTHFSRLFCLQIRSVPGRFAPNPVRPLSRFAPIPVRPGSFRPDLLIVL